MRYIIATNSTTGQRHPFLGVAPITHKDLAASARALGYDQVASAGFAHLGPALGVTTHYRSDGLGLSPAPDDAQLIALHYRATLDLVPEFQMRAAGAPASAHITSTANTVR